MSFETGPLAAVGWLLFVLGAAIAALATLSRGARLKSPTRRAADALMGVALCLAALAFLLVGSSAVTWGLLGGAALATAASWWLGRHARQVDRAARKAGRHR